MITEGKEDIEKRREGESVDHSDERDPHIWLTVTEGIAASYIGANSLASNLSQTKHAIGQEIGARFAYGVHFSCVTSQQEGVFCNHQDRRRVSWMGVFCVARTNLQIGLPGNWDYTVTHNSNNPSFE